MWARYNLIGIYDLTLPLKVNATNWKHKTCKQLKSKWRVYVFWLYIENCLRYETLQDDPTICFKLFQCEK